MNLSYKITMIRRINTRQRAPPQQSQANARKRGAEKKKSKNGSMQNVLRANAIKIDWLSDMENYA